MARRVLKWTKEGSTMKKSDRKSRGKTPKQPRKDPLIDKLLEIDDLKNVNGGGIGPGQCCAAVYGE
jgi:hypothetical protein